MVETDLSGKSMGDTLRTLQAATHNSNTVNMGDMIYINNLNSTNAILSGATYASLETFIKARQKANVKLAPQAN